MKRRYIGQQPRTKSSHRPGDKALINRRSTANFVPPSVYIGFPLFVLPRRRWGQLSTMPWGAKGSVVSWANRPVGVRSCPVPLRPAAPLCAAPNRSARCMSGFWVRQIIKTLKQTFVLVCRTEINSNRPIVERMQKSRTCLT